MAVSWASKALNATGLCLIKSSIVKVRWIRTKIQKKQVAFLGCLRRGELEIQNKGLKLKNGEVNVPVLALLLEVGKEREV
jgi:hypothetical protein